MHRTLGAVSERPIRATEAASRLPISMAPRCDECDIAREIQPSVERPLLRAVESQTRGFALTHLPLRCRMPRVAIRRRESGRTNTGSISGYRLHRRRRDPRRGRIRARSLDRIDGSPVGQAGRSRRCTLSPRSWTRGSDIASHWTATVEKELYRWLLSSRGILAIGLGLAGLAFLVGPSLGQQQDGSVRKAASPGVPRLGLRIRSRR